MLGHGYTQNLTCNGKDANPNWGSSRLKKDQQIINILKQCMPDMQQAMESAYHQTSNTSPKISASPRTKIQCFAFEKNILIPKAQQALITWINFNPAMSLRDIESEGDQLQG